MFFTINSEHRNSGTNSDFTVDLSSARQTALSKGGMLGVKNIEIPNTLYTIIPGQNGTFTYTNTTPTSKKIYLGSTAAPYKGSPSAAQLISNLTTQLNVNTDSTVFTMTLDPITARYTLTGTKNWSFTFDDIDAARVLGLPIGTTTISGLANVPYVFPGVVNLSTNKYFFLNTDITLNSGSNWDNFVDGTRNTLIKIPINVGNFANIFHEPNNITYHACAKISNQVRFWLTDAKNRIVDLNDVPFSFTLELIHP